MERTGCIYMATVNDDLSKCYIGYTVDFERRQKEHLSLREKGLFRNTLKKYGTDAVTWQIVEDDIPEHRLPDREELWIGWYDTYHNGLNMTPGGEAPPRMTPQTAVKVAETHRALARQGKNPMQRAEIQAKVSEIRRRKYAEGPYASQRPDVRAKMSATAKQKLAEGTHTSQLPHAKQAHADAMRSPEVRDKMSVTAQRKIAEGTHASQLPHWRAAHAASMNSEPVKEKLSKAARARAERGEHYMQSPEGKAALSARNKEKFAMGTHHWLRPEVVAKRERAKRRNRGILDWIDQLEEDDV